MLGLGFQEISDKRYGWREECHQNSPTEVVLRINVSSDRMVDIGYCWVVTCPPNRILSIESVLYVFIESEQHLQVAKPDASLFHWIVAGNFFEHVFQLLGVCCDSAVVSSDAI